MPTSKETNPAGKIVAAVIITFLVGCSGSFEVTDAATSTSPSAAITLPATVVLPTSTPTPFSLPQLTPVQIQPEGMLGLVPKYATARLGLGELRELAASPDGTRIAVGSSIGVHVFETSNLGQIWSASTNMAVARLAWSPDGRSIAAGLTHQRAIAFDAESGAVKWSYDGYLSLPNMYFTDVPVSFSPDGQHLATSGCTIEDEKDQGYCGEFVTHVWNAHNWSLMATHPGFAGGFQWSLDSTSLVAGPSAQVWNLVSDTTTSVPELPELGSHGAYVFSPDLTALAIGGEDTIMVVSWPDGKTLQTVPFNPKSGEDEFVLVWSPDSSRLITHRRFLTGDPYVLDVTSGNSVTLTLANMGTRTWGRLWNNYAWSPDGTLIAAPLNADNVWSTDPAHNFTSPFQAHGIGIWDWHTGQLVQASTSEQARHIRRIIWPTPERLVFSDWNESLPNVFSIDLDNPEENPAVVNGTDYRTAISWSPNGAQLVVGGNGVLELWDVKTQQIVQTCHDDDAYIYDYVEWPNDSGRRILAHNWVDHKSGFINLETCELNPTHDAFQVNHQSNPISPDKLRVAKVIENKSPNDLENHTFTLQVSEISSGNIVYEKTVDYNFDIHDTYLSWSPDEQRVAFIGTGFELPNFRQVAFLSLHDVATGRMQYTQDISGYDSWDNAISKILWSPDSAKLLIAHGGFGGGESLFVGIGDRAVINVVDAASGDWLKNLTGHTKDIMDMAWSPDGKTLASASADGTVILWQIDP